MTATVNTIFTKAINLITQQGLLMLVINSLSREVQAREDSKTLRGNHCEKLIVINIYTVNLFIYTINKSQGRNRIGHWRQMTESYKTENNAHGLVS